jgi:tetratricopeptide (TPR) repeat protein
MNKLQSVNLQWKRVERGLAGIGRHSLSNIGQLCAAVRDDLALGTYFLIKATDNGRGEAKVSPSPVFTMQRVSRVEATPAGDFAIAVTGSDLYCINAASVPLDRIAYQPSEGDRFVDVVLAATDPRRTFALLSAALRGGSHTLSLAEVAPTLDSLWFKEMTNVSSIAISSNGEWVAVGQNSGAVVLLNRLGQTLWSNHPEQVAGVQNSISSLAVDHQGSIVSINAAGVLRRHDSQTGRILWHCQIGSVAQPKRGTDSSSIFDVAASANSGVMVVAGYNYGDGDNAHSHYAIISGDTGSLIWKDSLDAIPSGASVSDSGEHICVTTLQGDIFEFTTQISSSPSSATEDQIAMAQTLFEEAQAALSSGQAQDAAPLLMQALVLNPTHINAALLYDESTWRLREETLSTTTEVSEDCLKRVEEAMKVLQHDEKLTIRRNALARLISEKYAGDAADFVSQNREEEAIAAIQKALILDNTNIDLRNALKTIQDRYVSRLSEDSQRFLARQMHHEAIDSLLKIIAIRPDEPGIHQRLLYSQTALAFNTGMKYFNSGRHALARFQFKKTLILDPNHPDAGKYIRLCDQAITAANAEHAAKQQ